MILDYNVLLNAPNLFRQLKMNSNKAFFIISLDNLMSTEKRLRAIIYKINKTSSECDFMICDTVNRFNIIMINKNLSEKEATQIALQNGNDWLKNNQKILSELTIPSQIIRWNEWLEHKNFKSKLKTIINEYNKNSACKDAFEKTARMFLSRRKIDIESNLNQCLMRLQEECAVMLLWADYGYNFELYTSKRNPAMEYTYQKLIKDNYPKNIMLPVIIDIKHKTKKEQEIINIAFNQLLSLDYGHIYVKDEEGYYLYCNITQAKSLGVEAKDVIGKTDYDFFSKEQANKYREVDVSVIKTGKISVIEEEWQHNEYKIFLSTKSPLFGNDNKVIGILGISIDITAEKKAEELKNQSLKIIAKEQEKFREIVGQVNHDIRSPLTSLQILTSKFAYILPEDERNTFNTAITRIIDIANNMMNYFKPKDTTNISELEECTPLLVSDKLLDILTEKKYEYMKKTILFTHNFSQMSNFAFIHIDSRVFGRMISNIINNAVDALEDNEGIVEVELNVKDDMVEIIIEDDGKGMPEKVKDKIMNNEAISAGKKDGHGIGLTQVRQTLQNSNGKLNIESELGVGTKIILAFPKSVAPNWMAERIKIEKGSLVVIVDDDPSIHGAWDSRFKVGEKEVTIKHFEIGEEAVDYLNNLSHIEREKVLLLTDYELLKQNINGLDVIKKSNIKNAILVTSYYDSPKVCEVAVKDNIKILPKALAVNIPIIFRENIRG